MGKNEIQNRFAELRARRAELLARSFGDAAVLHARGTGAFTGAAQETEIEVVGETLTELDPPFGGGLDQMNSAARRLRFQL